MHRAQTPWKEGDLAWYGVSVVKLLERRPGRQWAVQYLGFVQNSVHRVNETRLVAFHRCDEYRVTGVPTDRQAQAEGVRLARALLQPPNGPWGAEAGRNAARWAMSLGGIVRRFDLDVVADPIQNGVAPVQPQDARDAQEDAEQVAPVQANEIVDEPLPEAGDNDEVGGNDMADVEPQEREIEVMEEHVNAAVGAGPVIEEPIGANQLKRQFEEIDEDGIEEEREIDEEPPAKKARGVADGSWSAWLRGWLHFFGF